MCGCYVSVIYVIIQKVLAKRHGRMSDLKICLNNFSEANEINDEMLTLQECGISGQVIVSVTQQVCG